MNHLKPYLLPKNTDWKRLMRDPQLLSFHADIHIVNAPSLKIPVIKVVVMIERQSFRHVPTTVWACVEKFLEDIFTDACGLTRVMSIKKP